LWLYFFGHTAVKVRFMSIKLERLSPTESIAAGSIISIIGKRGTGKTLLLRALTYKLRDKIDFCIAMTPTTSSAEALAKVMPRQCIYDQGLNLDVIDRLMDTQTDNAARGSRVFSTLLILDDVSWDAASFKRPAPTLSKLYRNGRHMRITVICVHQDAMDLNVGLRGQVDIVILLRELSLQMRKRLHTCWFGLLSLQEFQCVLDKVTEDYGALCLLNNSKSNLPSECLFWYRANPNIPTFRLVNDIFWQFAEREVNTTKRQVQCNEKRWRKGRNNVWR
jgi:energy-coupling factor transporter ATP-binding protein EcfA2